MAIARLCMKVGKGGRAAPHAAYLARSGPYASRLGHGERLEASAAGNLPAWAAHDPLVFWQASDAHERANGTTYREMELALPRELNSEQREALVRTFIAEEIGDHHAWQYAIHVPLAADGQENPHAHLMFSERQVDGVERDPEQYFRRYNAKVPEKGGARKSWGTGPGTRPAARKEALKALRTRWEMTVNRALERAGREERIDMRSHRARGLARAPEPKQLPSAWRGEGRREVLAMREARAPLVAAERELAAVLPAPAETLALWRVRREHVQVRREVNRRRPPALAYALSREPVVRELTGERDAAAKGLGRLRYERQTVERHLAEWRKAHPYRFGVLGDVGLLNAREGRALEARRREIEKLLPAAEQYLETTEAALVAGVAEIGAPLRTAQERVRRELVPQERRLERLTTERNRLEARESARDQARGLDRDRGRERGGLSR